MNKNKRLIRSKQKARLQKIERTDNKRRNAGIKKISRRVSKNKNIVTDL